MFNLVYEFKLKPTRAQATLFEEWLEQCRRVYNYALQERKDWVNSRKCLMNACSIRHEYIIPTDAPAPTYKSQCEKLTQAKKHIQALKQVQSQVLQQTLKRLQQAFEGMWRNGRGFPRYRKRGRMRSYVFPQLGASPVQGDRVKLPKIGWVKLRQSRPIPDEAIVKQGRVVKKASGWYVQLTLQWAVDVPKISSHGTAIGIDLGLKYFVALSDGQVYPFIGPRRRLQGKLRSLQQKLKYKRLGSNNWHKEQAKVRRLHERISNIRKAFHWQVAHYLCDWANMIFAENLNLKALGRGLLRKHCLDAGWGQFLEILQACCFKRGIYFQKVDAKGTSSTCPKCLEETGKKKLSERLHKCQFCGYTCDRDTAAAQVVKLRGLEAVGHTA